MKQYNHPLKPRYQKRSAIIVWTAISTTTLLGFASLAIDLGYLKIVRAQLQNAADASAMAGAAGLISPAYLVGRDTQDDLAQTAAAQATEYCALNKADNKSLVLNPADLTVGHLTNYHNLNEQISVVQPYNAISVTIRKDADSPNGQVNLYFAAIWGKRLSSTSATATAYLDGHVSGYRADARKIKTPLIPVTVRRQKWINEIINAGGQDNYGYDPETGQITLGADGIPEISIFPEKQKDLQSSAGAGDFGLLNIGNGNQGVTLLAEQIQRGLSATDIIGQFGGPEIKFYTDNGTHLNYTIDGTPGAKNSLVQLENDFQARLNDVIGFFIHDTVTESGANADYTVSDIQFGRVMMVNGQGTINGGKVIVIQPVSYLGSEIVTTDAAVIHSTAGRVRLVR